MTQSPVKSHTIQIFLYLSKMYTYFLWTFYPKLPGKLIHVQVNQEEIGFFYSISIYFSNFAGKPLVFGYRTPPTSTVGQQ